MAFQSLLEAADVCCFCIKGRKAFSKTAMHSTNFRSINFGAMTWTLIRLSK